MGLPTSPPGGLPRNAGPKPSETLKKFLKKDTEEPLSNNSKVGSSSRDLKSRVSEQRPSSRTPLDSTVSNSKGSIKAEAKDNSQSDLAEGWAIDAKTGKKYKKLPAAPPEAIKAGRKSGLSKEQLEAITVIDDDFDIDDLNSTAEMFLSHLRVPPDKDEQKRLLEEKKKKRRASDAAYKAAQEFLDKKDKEREEKAKSKSRKDLM